MAIDDENLKEQGIAAEDEVQVIDWNEYWMIFWGNAWLSVAITSIFFIISTLYFFSLPNLYTATTTILTYPSDDTTPKTREDMIMPAFSMKEEYYGTQLAILTGRKMKQEVASELGSKASGYIIEARHIRDTWTLSLSITHQSPELAAKIANKFAEIFVRESRRQGAFIGQQILKLLPESSEGEPSTDSSPPSNSPGFNKQEFASSLNSVSNDPQIQRLNGEKLEAQSKLTELSQRYMPKHPAIQELNQRLEILDNEIKTRTDTILSNVKASLSGEANITNIKVLEEAAVPINPSAPQRLRGILIWTLGGFISSIVVIFLFEYSNQKIRTEHNLTEIGLCFLGYIPLTREFTGNRKIPPDYSGDEPPLIKALKTNTTLADSVTNARTHILFSMPYEKSRRIMLTSAIPGEGKSTLAALLAMSLTSLGRKILLIDADLRKPILHRYLNLRNEKGLSDYLVGSATMDEIIQPLRNEGLQLITAGTISPNPSELLSSERFRELLDKCGLRFDRIVIDVPPVLYIPDGLIVAKVVHTGILVCGAGMVHKKTIKQVKDKFDSIGYAFIGSIINRADFDRQGYLYRYYGTYKNYYQGPVGKFFSRKNKK